MHLSRTNAAAHFHCRIGFMCHHNKKSFAMALGHMHLGQFCKILKAAALFLGCTGLTAFSVIGTGSFKRNKEIFERFGAENDMN